MNRARFGLAAGLACFGLGCGSGTEPPPPPPPPPAGPGPISFELVTPADVEDGALLLTVLGGAVDSVTGAAGYEVFHALTPAGAKAIVIGSIVDGPLVRVWVPDASRSARYAVQVEEGAARATYGVVPSTSYQVIRRP